MANILIQNSVKHYAGRLSDRPKKLQYGDYYYAEDVNQLYKYDYQGFPRLVGSQVLLVSQRADNYNALQDGSDVGDLSYVKDSVGTQWLPGTVGGTYYTNGWYIWDGSSWNSDRNAIANQLEMNTRDLENKSDIGHTHTISEIVDFPDLLDLEGQDGQDGQDGTNGTNGTDGTDGADGQDGSDGQGVPAGGSAGQVLEKVDGTDYNTQWITPSSGGTTINFFQVQDDSGSGQQLASANYVDANSAIWGSAFVDTGFSWDGTELTVEDASNAIEFNVSIQGITSSNSRVELGVRLMEDTGSGYLGLTTVSQYALRNNLQNEGNVTLVSFYVFNVAAGTKYKIQASNKGGATNIGTQGGTYFNAKRFSQL